MKLHIGDKIKYPKNIYVLEARGSFGNEDFYWKKEYPSGQLDESTGLLEDFVMLQKLSENNKLNTREDMEEYLESQNLKVNYIPVDSQCAIYLPQVDTINCMYYNNLGHAFKVRLVE